MAWFHALFVRELKLNPPDAYESHTAEIAALLRARHPCIALQTLDEKTALDALTIQGHAHVWTWSVVDGVRDAMLSGETPIAETADPAAGLYYLMQHVEHPALCVTLDMVEHLTSPKVLRMLRDLIHRYGNVESTLVMIDHRGPLPDVIRAVSTPARIHPPHRAEIERIVRSTLQAYHQDTPIEVDLSKRDLETIVRNLSGLSRPQIERIVIDVVTTDQRLDADDVNGTLARKRQVLHRDGLLEYIESPVDLDTIGGLVGLKRWLVARRDAISPRAEKFGLPAPRGVLMLGVQGAGKSLCAKAIATGWQRPLLRLDPGILYDRFVGESERRLREALAQVQVMAPNVLWIDEIEKGFASAASRSTDGGLSQRMFGSLLTWMQEHDHGVFVVATANDIEALPPELLRKGRFDEIFFVDLPDESARHAIFEIHLNKRNRDPHGFDLAQLAAASDGFSGAEIEQAIIAGLHEAFATGQELTTRGLTICLSQTHPLSVTMAEKVAALRQWARGRCTIAN
jgi:SpoVK/Ycf46/Vps4 family AAA+-type ATPase